MRADQIDGLINTSESDRLDHCDLTMSGDVWVLGE